MKCPHCEQELTGRICMHCQAVNIDSGPYCSYCGKRLEASPDNPEAAENEEIVDSDWENRILCSDGDCIGVIGPDGRCKECGKVYQEA